MSTKKTIILSIIVIIITVIAVSYLGTYLPNSTPSNNHDENQPNPFQSQTPQPTDSHSLPVNLDSDNDGLTDAQERSVGTSLLSADTDSDGLNDGLEVNNYKTNPLLADTDSDDLNDGLEVNSYNTNPLVRDTDSDNLNDGLEVFGWPITVSSKQMRVTSNPLMTDTDADLLSDNDEFSIYKTNPSSIDTDSDELPDKWEITYSFSPVNSYDASTDPDLDGLTNAQEYKLGTILSNNRLSYEKDLFIEIDYMLGYEPSQTALTYLVSYFKEIGITVHTTVDDCVYTNELTEIGISPTTLDSQECHLIESKYHDFYSTHVYVFYAKALDKSSILGWASSFGAFMNMDEIKQSEGAKVLWLTDRIRVEKTVLLHEIGHTINVIIRDQVGNEDYCSNLGCIMSAADEWYDVVGGISQLVVMHSDSPRYCQNHRVLIDLTNKWSVDESWIK